MELFTKLFGSLLVFVYHCFDRIVIHGYLSALSRPEQVVFFFRQIVVDRTGLLSLPETTAPASATEPSIPRAALAASFLGHFSSLLSAERYALRQGRNG